MADLGNKKSLGKNEECYSLINQALLDYEVGDYPSSEHYLIKSILLVRNKTPEAIRLRKKAILQLGRIYLQMGKMKEAKVYLDSSLVFFKSDSIHLPIKLAQAYYSEGLWAKKNNQLDKAVQNYSRAIALFESSETSHFNELGKCYNNIANAYEESAAYSKAKFFFLKSLALKIKHGADSLSIAITNNNLGRFYRNFGNFIVSRGYFEKSIALLNEQNPRHSKRLPEFLNNYANLLLETEEQELSEKYFLKALKLSFKEGLPTKKSIPLFLSLAGVKILKGDLVQAEQMLTEANSLLSRDSSSALVSIWYLTEANLKAKSGEYKKANEDYSKALLRTNVDSNESGEIYFYWGLLLERMHSFADAIAKFHSSIALTKGTQGFGNLRVVSAYNLIGECHLNTNQLDSALHFLHLAINENVVTNTVDKSQQALYPFELIASCYFLSQVYQKKYFVSSSVEDLSRSEEYVEMGLHAIDAKRKALSSTNDQLQFDEKIADFFSHAAEVFYKVSLTDRKARAYERLFYVSELSKSQSLGSLLRKSNLQTFADIPTLLRQREENLSKELQNYDLQLLREIGYGPDANHDLLEEYKEKLNQTSQSYQYLQDSLREKLPGYYQFKYNKTLVSLPEVQHDLLNPEKALLQFSMGDSLGFCQVIMANNQFVFPITHLNELKKRILALRNQIKLRMDEPLYENANWLYAQLIQPAESFFRQHHLRINQLIIVPDQILCYLPFETLVADVNRKHFLLSDYSISYALSSTLLWQKETETKALTKKSFVGLAPEFKTSYSNDSRTGTREEATAFEQFQFQPLTGNRVEVDAIKNELDKKNIQGTVLKGAGATEASFRQLDLSTYDYIHFATHGFVDMDHPQFSGIAFSKADATSRYDDILYTNEIYDMHLNAQLVCISSCDSGLGKMYRGEGIVGLSRAFFYAGARNLAVSLWKVDDVATSDLMVSFYAKIISTNNLSKALASAKRKMASSKKYQHPYYWAPFILLGE